MGRLFFIRHGETALNEQSILQGPRIDAELNARGHEQAWLVASALVAHNIEALYTSPLLRARQTAQAIVDASGGRLEARILPDIYELDYGELAGAPKATVADAVAQVFDAWGMGFLDTSFPGGESAVVAQQRVRPTVGRLIELARQSNVAVVAHGHINRILLATALSEGLEAMGSYPQDNAAISELDVGDVIRVIRLNDTAHLRPPAAE